MGVIKGNESYISKFNLMTKNRIRGFVNTYLESYD